MSQQFDEAFALVIGNEGGYVNNPTDPGGETKWGISKRAYPKLNIKSLTVGDAKAIYLKDYWHRAGCAEFDDMLAVQVFDAAVNHGVTAAVKMLQNAVGEKADGVLGPKTLAAVDLTPGVCLTLRFLAERLEYYTGLRGFKDSGKGWVSRVANNINHMAKELDI